MKKLSLLLGVFVLGITNVFAEKISVVSGLYSVNGEFKVLSPFDWVFEGKISRNHSITSEDFKIDTFIFNFWGDKATGKDNSGFCDIKAQVSCSEETLNSGVEESCAYNTLGISLTCEGKGITFPLQMLQSHPINTDDDLHVVK